jgi:hypothetical protein
MPRVVLNDIACGGFATELLSNNSSAHLVSTRVQSSTKGGGTLAHYDYIVMIRIFHGLK